MASVGVPGGIQASEENLRFLISKLPAGSTFNVAGIGRAQLPMAELSLKLGGHARCGLEDNIYSSKGVLAKETASRTVSRLSAQVHKLGA